MQYIELKFFINQPRILPFVVAMLLKYSNLRKPKKYCTKTPIFCRIFVVKEDTNMYIAQQKRKENIAEYILYLWQLEDLLRALRFSPEAIYTSLVEPNECGEQEKQQIFMWYMSLVGLLKEEGKEQSGHLAHTLHLIADVENLHNQLLALPIGAHYRTLWEPLKEELSRLRIVIARDGIGDIELCFRALYATMLYRLKGDQTKAGAIEDVTTLISPVIATLADTYRKVERGEVDLFGK